jgi:hypothetical protein
LCPLIRHAVSDNLDSPPMPIPVLLNLCILAPYAVLNLACTRRGVDNLFGADLV